jgi:hypothetical protein
MSRYKIDVREHDGHLTRTTKQVRFGKLKLRTRKKFFCSMLSLEHYREALLAEVVECALFATPNALKSFMTQKTKSPFSKVRAVTSKLCFHSIWTGAVNRPGFNSPSITKSP